MTLSSTQIALRWVSHHSLLDASKGDNILGTLLFFLPSVFEHFLTSLLRTVGASSLGHLESNLADLEKGPLPEDVVAVLDEAWQITKSVASSVRPRFLLSSSFSLS